MTEIEKIIRELLKEMSQEELARSIGVSLRSVQNYITGTRPRREVARRIRELKGVPHQPSNNNHKEIVHPDAFGLISARVIQIEAMQRVQLTLLQELYSKSLGIPNMEAGMVIDKALGQTLQKLKEELQQGTS